MEEIRNNALCIRFKKNQKCKKKVDEFSHNVAAPEIFINVTDVCNGELQVSRVTSAQEHFQVKKACEPLQSSGLRTFGDANFKERSSMRTYRVG